MGKNTDVIAHVEGRRLTFTLLVLGVFICAGCWGPYPGTYGPQPRPINPVPQPIGPFPQPISQPFPQPISKPISPPPIQPISQPGTPPISLSGTPSQRAIIEAALDRCTFPFERMRPGLQRAGLRTVNISWRSMGEGTKGWASTGGEVAINESIGGLEAQRTAILEMGHTVDFFYLTPEMRREIVRLWHPELTDDHGWLGSTAYWNQVGEAYSTLFLWAFTDEEMWFDAGYSHKPSRELAAKLRAIMLPDTITSRR